MFVHSVSPLNDTGIGGITPDWPLNNIIARIALVVALPLNCKVLGLFCCGNEKKFAVNFFVIVFLLVLIWDCKSLITSTPLVDIYKSPFVPVVLLGSEDPYNTLFCLVSLGVGGGVL